MLKRNRSSEISRDWYLERDIDSSPEALLVWREKLQSLAANQPERSIKEQALLLARLADDYLTYGVQEIEIKIFGEVEPYERAFFNGLTGVGHPGSPGGVSFLRAEFRGKEIQLTQDEEDRAVEKLQEELED